MATIGMKGPLQDTDFAVDLDVKGEHAWKQQSAGIACLKIIIWASPVLLPAHKQRSSQCLLSGI